MQAFDLRGQLRGERNGRLQKHPASGEAFSCCRAVEPEPDLGFDELAVAIDEIRNPETAVAQIDRDFSSLAQAQQLAENGADTKVLRVEVHARILIRQAGDVFKELSKTDKSAAVRGALCQPESLRLVR